MHKPSLALKVIAPKIRRGFVFRLRLEKFFRLHDETRVLLVEAPAGFGKTVLLAQWRRAAMAAGAPVAWVTLAERDTALDVVEAIALAIQQATGRHRFAFDALASSEALEHADGAVSHLAAEWAALANPPLLVLDDFERVTDARAQAVLLQLVRQLPDHCRLLVGTRPLQERDWVADLQSYGHLAQLTQKDLAFTLEESFEFLCAQCPQYVDSNLFARLHRLTEGWPVGLEIAAARLKVAPPHEAALMDAQTQAQGASAFLLKKATANLSPRARQFLLEVSLLDHFCVSLCAAIDDQPDVATVIDELRAGSGLLIEGEGSEWFRLHQLALEPLRKEAHGLPAVRLRHWHARAARWFADRGYWDAAAHHAFAAPDQALAIECVKNGILATHRAGKLELVSDWLERLPESEVMQSVDLRLSVARSWAVAGGGERARCLVADLLSHGCESIRYKAALVCGSAAVHADDPDAAQHCIAPWPLEPPTDDVAWRLPFFSMRHWLDETSGRHGPLGSAATWPVSFTGTGEAALTEALAHQLKAVGYLNEGQPVLALELLSPVLAWVEELLGRRSGPAVLLGGTMAFAACELGDAARARLLLADRHDLIDPGLLPGGCALATVAAATLARVDGQEHRALSILETFRKRAAARALTRNEAVALGELIRLHAVAGRSTTVEALLNELLQVSERPAARGLCEGDVVLQLHLAQARGAMLRRHWKSAHRSAQQATERAQHMGRRRVELEARLVRAAIAWHESGTVEADLADAASSAVSLKLQRLLLEVDPVLEPFLSAQTSPAPAASAQTPMAQALPRQAATLLTQREQEVLTLLAKGMSNKEIANCLELGDGTVKWHVKNLFTKLEAGDRRTAVGRARRLGLIE
ncbi:LuxR C-terminal-related transcriptional regulator [Hydrogenophaga sp. BPS33]|uniref:LuxR C-terminal-related transcriptional regulator n=1 Tax=Hydrogenophaga sp. BPS33 TaxID=2651974 RepID=UPI00135BF5F1|nr:LuxR C-terminal-related transcriptional regulator [Hydrogenophaga sp. BPS33]